MGNSAVAIPRREHLSRTLVYRSSLVGSLAAFLLLAGLAALFSIGAVEVGKYFAGEAGVVLALTLICPIIFGVVMVYLAARHLMRPIADLRVRVDQEQLQIQVYGTAQSVSFDQIVDVKAFCLPYLGGWLTLVLEDGREITFSAMLERSEYIVDAIARERPELVASDKILDYRRTAIGVDHSWARLVEELQDWRRQFLVHIGCPAVFAAVAVGVLALSGEAGTLFEKWLMVTGILILPAIVIGAGAWCVRDYFFLRETHRQLKKDPGALARNRGWEASVRVKFFRAQMALTALVAVALTIFLMFH